MLVGKNIGCNRKGSCCLVMTHCHVPSSFRPLNMHANAAEHALVPKMQGHHSDSELFWQTLQTNCAVIVRQQHLLVSSLCLSPAVILQV